jgi:hypothetical protein
MSNQNSESTQAAENPAVTSESPASLELTAYQGGAAVFREKRVVVLTQGRNRLYLAGLPATFQPDSLTVDTVEAPEGSHVKIGPYSDRQANLTPHNILQGSIGRTITLIEQTASGFPSKVTGKLRHVLGNQLVLERPEGGLVVVPLTPKYELPEGLPAGLSALPSLLMEPTVSQDGRFGFNILYEADGVVWTPRYEVFYDAAAEVLRRFACYADITNQSGARLENACLELIAGYNQGAGAYGGGGRRMHTKSARSLESTREAAPMAALASVSADAAAVEDVGEEKLYVLPDRLTLENGETKHPFLVFAQDVPVKPEYILHAGHFQQAKKEEDLPKQPIYVRLRVNNDKASNLGLALPAGEVSVKERSKSGRLQKTDTSVISAHVAADEPFRLDLSKCSKDLKATRRLVDFKQDPEPPQQDDDDETTPQPPVVRPLAEPQGGFIDEGPHPLPTMTMGGPEVGTPEEHAEVRRQAVEAAGRKKKEKKEKKPAPRFREEEREVTIHNYKDKAVEVLVSENFGYKNVQVLKKSQDFAEETQSSGTFKVTVPAKGKASVSYRIKWQIN